LALERRCWRTRGFGDFWPYVMVADGSIDIAVEPEGLSVWDLAAPMVIVEAAGGRFTDLEGVAWPDGGSAVATNGLLHDEVLAALVPSP
jgi:histidinol-phosphatase